MVGKIDILRAVVLLLAAQQGIIELTDDDRAFIRRALGR